MSRDNKNAVTHYNSYAQQKRIILLIVCVILLTLAFTVPSPEGLSHEGLRMLFITLIAFVLWVFELVPIQLTALIIIFLEFALEVVPFKTALNNFAHPVGLLLFAGFALSAGIQKCKLDRFIIGKIIAFGGKDTRKLLLLLMYVVGFLSMWISNTATCAIMMPFTVAVVSSVKDKNKKNISKIYAIGIAYAATMGGVGTPIGTTTNPIVIAGVKEMLGVSISFITWLGIGIPIVILLIPIGWFLLIRIFPPEIKEFTDSFDIDEFNINHLNARAVRMVIIFAMLVILWFSEVFFVVPDNWIYITSFFIAIFLFLPYVGVLDWSDSKHVDVGIIVIVAGGIALGKGLLSSGAISWILDSIIPQLQMLPLFVITAILAMLTGLGVLFFCGITATASTFVPISIILAINLGYNGVIFAAIAGISSTFAYLLPASTAPNAIAFSTGYFHTNDMLKVGIPLLIISLSVVVLIGNLFWPLFL